MHGLGRGGRSVLGCPHGHDLFAEQSIGLQVIGVTCGEPLGFEVASQ
jgi:hypothetical protein